MNKNVKLLFCVGYVSFCPGMDNYADNNSVLIFYFAKKSSIQSVIENGLTVCHTIDPFLLPSFSYIKPSSMEFVEKQLWKKRDSDDYAVAIQVDPSVIYVANKYFRLKRYTNMSDQLFNYKKSMMLLIDYIQQMKNNKDLKKEFKAECKALLTDSYTAELFPTYSSKFMKQNTGLVYWNEFIPLESISPQFFVSEEI